MEKQKIEVDESLKAKDDGRKKAWFIKEIEDLKEKNAELEARLTSYEYASETQTNDEPEITLDYKSYAQGFADCMGKFQILTKKTRAQVKLNLETNGPAGIRKIKHSKFRGVSI